jgi:hypothetical protein
VKSLRCSSLDSLDACAPSVLDEKGAVRISTAGEPAELGNLVHALATDYIDFGKFDVAGECGRQGMESLAEDATELMGQVVRIWDELRRFFPQPKTERVVKGELPDSPWTITGTVDVLSPVGANKAIFLDWKSGWAEGYANQMFGYAWCIWNLLGRPDDAEFEVVGIIAFLRHRKYNILKYNAKKLAEWEYKLLHNVLSRSSAYHPGEHCSRCPIYAGCQARQEVVQGTLTALMLPKHTPITDPSAKALSKAIGIISQLTVDNKNAPEVGRRSPILTSRSPWPNKS